MQRWSKIVVRSPRRALLIRLKNQQSYDEIKLTHYTDEKFEKTITCDIFFLKVCIFCHLMVFAIHMFKCDDCNSLLSQLSHIYTYGIQSLFIEINAVHSNTFSTKTSWKDQQISWNVDETRKICKGCMLIWFSVIILEYINISAHYSIFNIDGASFINIFQLNQHKKVKSITST